MCPIRLFVEQTHVFADGLIRSMESDPIDSCETAWNRSELAIEIGAGFNPLAYPVGVAEGCQLAKGIEQYNTQWLASDFGFHRQAASGFVQIACLAQLNTPSVRIVVASLDHCNRS